MLEGRIGIITGASSGIGFATANKLADAGATVYAISRSGEVKTGESSHPSVIHIKGDVSDYNGMKDIIDEIGKSKGIDFLINNAGITMKKRAEEISVEEFDRICQINLTAPFALSTYAFSYLKKSKYKGRIVNISSMAGYLGFSEVVPYSASKSGIQGLTRGLAVEWAQDNITVNSVAPSWFPSEMNRQVMDAERKEKILGRMPLHEFGNPDDIGAIICFLLSDNARYITGCDYPVDGGALAFGY